MRVMWWLALFLMQDAQSQADRVRAAMAESLAKQRLSVQRQAESVRAAMGQQAIPDSWVRLRPPVDADCGAIPQVELARMIDDAAEKHGIDSGVIREVARQESGFHPCAISSKGAEGLMQLMPSTQIQFQVSNPFDAKQSIDAGSKLLKDLLDRYHGDLSLALSAYNAGATTVDRAGGIPEIPETKNYVMDVLTRLLQ
jgi:soluble lytic murein transglycosylase-like protein